MLVLARFVLMPWSWESLWEQAVSCIGNYKAWHKFWRSSKAEVARMFLHAAAGLRGALVGPDDLEILS